MKKILKGLGVFVLSVAMVGVFSLPVMAQAPTGRQYKMSGSFNLESSDLDFKTNPDEDDDTYKLVVGVGYFINDMFEIGPEIIYNYEKEDNEKLTAWALGVKANAHFDTGSQVIPYVGLNFAFSSLDISVPGLNADDTSIMYGFQAGLDYFLTENLSINPELRYTTGASYNLKGYDELDISSMELMVGIAAHF